MPHAYAAGLLPLCVGRLTPGELREVIAGRERRQIATAWWTERLRRERILKPLQRYLTPVRRKTGSDARKDYEELKTRLGRR